MFQALQNPAVKFLEKRSRFEDFNEGTQFFKTICSAPSTMFIPGESISRGLLYFFLSLGLNQHTMELF